MGAIFPPIIFKGTVGLVAVTSISQGARIASTPASPISAGLVVGDHLFVYKQSDLTEGEYLGKITALTSSTVSFQFPAQVARGASTYVLGKPAAYWQAPSTYGTGGVTISEDLGIETLDTTGTNLIHSKLREPREYTEVVIRDAKAAEWLAYRSFIKASLGGGLSVFTAAFFDRETGKTRCNRVKFRQPGTALQAQSQASVLRTWPMDLQILLRDAI